MKLEERMHQVKSEVDEALVRFFAKKRQEAKRIHPSTVALVDQIADLTLRAGKRVRPFLCWVGYEAVQVIDSGNLFFDSRNQRLIHVMVGLELFQTFALIHDDIMDESAERRGGKSIHASVGKSMAILAGDLALVWADEEMGRAGKAVQALYQKMKEEVMYGQALDVMREAGASDVAQERVDELKTAWYSVVRPLQIGSCLAISGSPSRSQSPPGRWPKDSFQVKCFEVWERYGVPVGKLFQLRDDFLDGAIDEKTFKKKAEVLRNIADQALTDAVIADHTRVLLLDIVQFVCTRKS